MISKYINNFGVACESLHGTLFVYFRLIDRHNPDCTLKSVSAFSLFDFHFFYFENFTGDKPQSQRTKILDDFRSGRSNIIVATDVAARGLGKWSFTQLRFLICGHGSNFKPESSVNERNKSFDVETVLTFSRVFTLLTNEITLYNRQW